MKYLKVIIIIFIVFICTGCKMTCVKIENNEHTDNYFRVIVTDKIELSNSYTLNDSGLKADNKDELLMNIKDYLDKTYNTSSTIENSTVNMNVILDKDNNIFGDDLNKFTKYELYKYFKEKGYTCR